MFVIATAGSNTLSQSDNSFENNSAAIAGGGEFLLIAPGTATLSNDSFIANHAKFGGGLFVRGNSGGTMGTVDLSHSWVIGNSASEEGGGVYVGPAITAKLTNDTITWNRADVAGGGVYNHDGTLIDSSSLIRENSSSHGPNIYGPNSQS